MKKTIVVMAALALSYCVNAQTFDEGVKMYKYERYQSAEKILAPLAAGNPMANYYLGLAQLGNDDVADAKTTFSKFPEDAANMAGMARIALLQNNATLAMQLATAVAGKAKKKEWEQLKYAADAMAYTPGGNIQQAIDWYKQALAKYDDASTHIALGDAYQNLPGGGGGGEAMNNYEHVTEKDPKNTFAFTSIGELWYAAHNYQSALDNYNKAMEADPNNPLPYKYLGQAYFNVAKYDLSLKNITRYLELSDKSIADKIFYAQVLYQDKHYSEAMEEMQQLINSGVKKPSYFGILGFSQFELHDSVNALKNARVYITTQNPEKITISDYQTYAKIFMANSMTDSANFYFNKSIATDTSKNKSEVYRQIAEIFRFAKEFHKSAEWYAKMIAAYPDTQPVDYFWETVMYYYDKDYDKAGIAAQQFETTYPKEASATYWRGRAAAAVDSECKTGLAVPFFKKWLDKVGPNYDKKNDMKIAYEYLLLFDYNTKDKAEEQKYKDLIRALDPNDTLLKNIDEAEKQAAAPKKPAAAKPKK